MDSEDAAQGEDGQLEDERRTEQSAELKWLRHNQAALDARLARVEDSVLFRALRAAGTYYQTTFRGGSRSSARDYRAWAARHTAPPFTHDPAWRYQPVISVTGEGATAQVLQPQTYRNWTTQTGGDYTADIPAGVFPSPGSFARAVAAMQHGPPARIYFDHELIDESGEAIRPVFKPDWSPVLDQSCDYRGPFQLVAREAVGGGVLHITGVAYQARTGPRFKRNALAPAGNPLVSILICTRNEHLLSRCLASLRAKTAYAPYEIAVVHHRGGTGDEAIQRIAQEQNLTRVDFSAPFNFSAMNNAGARAAKGDLLLFLNDDVEPLESDWLGRLVAWLERPDVGAVGAKLVFPNGAIQHAGIATWLIDGAGHPGRNMTASDYWPWLNTTREVTAVTGACLCVRRRDFERTGGFDERFPVNFNDVDLCLRLREEGLSVIVDTGAVLQHDESRTRKRGVDFEERRRFFLRWWKRVEKVDPFYSPFLAQNNEDLSLRELTARD